METIVVHPENLEQLEVLKAFMEEQNINFEVEQNEIPLAIINEIELSRKEAKDDEILNSKANVRSLVF
ncbi:DUF2683 family protein [Pedobacter jejuensis]|uniref:Uncharacterized protein n=1 Tax=Pedobacter jejuensis TaxID=1268550 RepID=A0A3N0C2Z0_9SPHI|nr:DUF2683 family protein [Pedobacter jejuensis]RNL56865.1 hypothetical protein D7004_00160 [Pedobacter jejuensis]